MGNFRTIVKRDKHGNKSAVAINTDARPPKAAPPVSVPESPVEEIPVPVLGLELDDATDKILPKRRKKK